MTPGTYLRLRREAAGLSIVDVAARLSTEPRWAEHLRAEWIGLIEAGASSSFHTVVALGRAFPFDLHVLEALVKADLGIPGAPFLMQICRTCGCTQDDACAGGCWWAEPDLCSSCVDPVAAVDAIHAAAGGGAA